jgi:hypothetical protein
LLFRKDAKEDSSINMISTARSSPSWKVVYEDEHSVLFESRNKNECATVKESNIRGKTQVADRQKSVS